MTLFLFGWIINSYGQKTINDLLYNKIVEVAENNIESDASNADFNTFLENLEYYALHPMNLNSVDYEDLEMLGLLTEFEIDKIIQYRERLNGFVEVRELILAGINKEKVDVLELFFDLKSIEIKNLVKDRREILHELNHQMFLRYQRVLENKKGYLTNKYQGNQDKYYFRYAVNYGRQLQMGVVLEKDDGESFYTKDNSASIYKPLQGFDYRNGFFAFSSKSIVKQTVIGSYNIQLGQGLLSWSGFAFGKSAYVLQTKKTGQMLRSYTSVNENNFYKGIASIIEVGGWKFLPYFSSKKIDANATVLDTISNTVKEVSSFQNTGYHRTISEIEDEKSIKENIIGTSVGRKIKDLEIRGNYQYINYSAKLEESDKLYQKHNFKGKNLQNLSLDYKYRKGKLSFYGESVVQTYKKIAHLIGVNFLMNSRLTAVLLYRNYGVGYFAPYSNGFSENSATSNEKGIYIGFDLSPSTNWKVTAYVDNYKKPWLAFGVASPSYGTDFLIQVNHIKNKYLEHYLRFKYELKETNSDTDNQINNVINQTKWRARYHLNYDVSSKIKIRSRLEMSGLKQESINQYGVLLYQDLKLKLFNYKLDLITRFAYFETPTFETAIYAYENDVLYSFSVPGYYNSGMRYYTIFSFDINENTKLWIRFSRWIYANIDSISSGDSEIMGDTKSELKLQLRVQL